MERDDERVQESLLTSFVSRWISECKCSISAAREVDGAVLAEEGAETAATEGMATSIILSAISANLSRVVPSGVDASTILTFWGNHNSRKNELSTPGRFPISCCILRSNCVGLRSPNSSPVNSCCSLRFPDRAVRLVSCSFSAEYGLSAGGLIRRSLTSAANSGAKDETTWLNLECWDVISLQANCVSTWANHTFGSAGQKGGSFRVTIAENVTRGGCGHSGGSGRKRVRTGSTRNERFIRTALRIHREKCPKSVEVTIVAIREGLANH